MKPLRTFGLLATLIASAMPESADAQDAFALRRADMVAEIAAMARATGAETGRPAFGARVMAAIGKVQRHLLVPEDQVRYAYENRPLSIGHGQTISQPYIVALMTDLMDPKPTDVVLEVGTGSGYQAAVLGELVAKVYTIEIVEPVGRRAAEAAREARLQERVHAHRRRLQRLARGRAVRCDHRHRGRRPRFRRRCSTSSSRAAGW